MKISQSQMFKITSMVIKRAKKCTNEQKQSWLKNSHWLCRQGLPLSLSSVCYSKSLCREDMEMKATWSCFFFSCTSSFHFLFTERNIYCIFAMLHDEILVALKINTYVGRENVFCLFWFKPIRLMNLLFLLCSFWMDCVWKMPILCSKSYKKTLSLIHLHKKTGTTFL